MDPLHLVARARAVWESRAGGSAAFSPAPRVAVVPESGLCPPGWAGVVSIAGAVIATAPGPAAAVILQRALGQWPAAVVADGEPAGAVSAGADMAGTDLAGPDDPSAVLVSADLPGAELLRRLLPVADLRGPAALAYLDATEFRPGSGRPPGAAGVVSARDLRRFLSECDPADAEESGLAGITSPAFAFRELGEITAAAGYREWRGGVAHLSVLTAAPARGRGLARAVASAAVAHALGRGLLPQWRAMPPASRRVAAALGFRELGWQASILLRA
jgi:GNAT superfamily N-acetyltransferase